MNGDAEVTAPGAPAPAPPVVPGHVESLTRLRSARPAPRILEELLEAVGVPQEERGRLDLREMARTLSGLVEGYRSPAVAIASDGAAAGSSDEPILVRGIPFTSLCRTHLLPFRGRAHVGYLPDVAVADLRRIVDLVRIVTRRLHTQAGLTDEIAGALDAALAPRGVVVWMEAEYLCPGVPASVTTQAYLGEFRKPLWRERLERMR